MSIVRYVLWFLMYCMKRLFRKVVMSNCSVRLFYWIVISKRCSKLLCWFVFAYCLLRFDLSTLYRNIVLRFSFFGSFLYVHFIERSFYIILSYSSVGLYCQSGKTVVFYIHSVMAAVWPDAVTHFLCVSVRTCGTYVRAEGHPEECAGGTFRRRWHAARCSGAEGFSGGNIGDDMTYRKWLRCNRCYSKQTVVSAVPTTWREPSGTSHVSQPLMPFLSSVHFVPSKTDM